MRIKEIKIIGLFGMFDHVIPLNLDTHLSIIYGINGVGKTTVFKMLECFFNVEDKLTRFASLRDIEFQKLEILFEDDTTYKCIKKNTDIAISIRNEVKKISAMSIFSCIREEGKWLDVYFPFDETHISGLEKIDYDTFLDHSNNENMSLEQVFDKYSHTTLEARNTWNAWHYLKQFPKEQIDIVESLHVYSIGVDRLTTLIKDTNSVGRTFIKRLNSVKHYSDDFSELIMTKQEEYAYLTESLESSLGKRILSREIKTNLDKDALKKIVFEVQKRRSELQKIGLIESLEEDNLTIPDDLDSGTQAVLSVSFQDIQMKLKIFDELYEKLSLFLEILNERRFSFKQISVNQEEGFIIVNDNSVQINLAELSTGEQHELILLYLLLFKMPENSLILIDEPETSLHIDWQAAFLEDMEDIIKLRKFDILISTHSPDIVNGRQELTIPLYGQKLQLQ